MAEIAALTVKLPTWRLRMIRWAAPLLVALPMRSRERVVVALAGWACRGLRLYAGAHRI